MRQLSLLLLASLLASGCGDDDAPVEDGGSALADAGDAGSPYCLPYRLSWTSPPVATTVGVARTAVVGIERDVCEDRELQLRFTEAGVASAPATAIVAARTSEVSVLLTGEAVGTTTLVASYTDAASGETFEARLEVRVVDAVVPGCSGSASGRLEAGGAVRLDDGAGVALQEGASNPDRYQVEPFEVSVDCASSIVPAGYRPVGPAVTVSPAHVRLPREIPITLPAELALLPEGARRRHVEFVYQGSGVEPRIVPVASPDYSRPGFVTFLVPRLGTYQAVHREGVPVVRDRTFVFNGIMGVSMGSGGSSLIGTHNPERFDFVAPLGGPVDWIHMLHYIRTWHLGGFCTEVERQLDPEGCAAGARTDRTPPTDRLHEVPQDFEHWNFVDELGGQGGIFDRRSYMQIFRDLARMYENPNSTRSLDPGEPNITPPGVPDSERMRPRAERCSDPVVIPGEAEGGDDDATTGFYDDEYNPEGRYPVITFCDGSELRVDGSVDIGIWNPAPDAPHDQPVEVALAVDIDGDGRRGPGEPIIRQGREPFEDCGVDQVCDEDEPSYDPVTNRDPSGDDYDFQYNPTGTEKNWVRDYLGAPVGDCASPTAAAGMGERFSDVGLDGVAGTPQLGEGGYDSGEADGCWTMARGMERMLANNPRGFVRDAPLEALRDLDFFGDGGVRDLFNFGSNQDQLAGAFVARGLPLTLFDGHASLLYDGSTRDSVFDQSTVPWEELGRYIQVRYGHVDADAEAIAAGDGAHVGTNTQILNRLLSAVSWMSHRWPDGDRELSSDNICTQLSSSCPHVNYFTFDFTSSRDRTGPVAVVLPPGYFDPANADRSYPVVYLLHGYGMSPEDLLASGLLIWSFMRSRTIPEADRLQKMIFVFPDGQCRGDECLRGTFFADSPESNPGGAQMETFMLDLMDHMDATYRTRAPESFRVVE